VRPRSVGVPGAQSHARNHPGGEVRVDTSVLLKSTSAPCPDCAAEVRLAGRPLIGEVVGCGACGAQLEVTHLTPPRLEPLAPIDEGFADTV